MSDATSPQSSVPFKTTERLTLGNGGWLRYQSSSQKLPVPVFVRVQPDGERFRISEVYFGGPGVKVTGQMVREIPFNRIEAWANEYRGNLEARRKLAGPDLRTLVSHFNFDPPNTLLRPPDAPPLNWVERSFLAQVDKSGEPPAPELPVAEPLPTHEVSLAATLAVPASPPYGDDFYRSVAEVYQRLVRYVRAPAGAIADANGVETTRAHRWIKVARQRGFLPPAAGQGKAG